MQSTQLPDGFFPVCEQCRSIGSIMFYLPLIGLLALVVAMAWLQVRENAFLAAIAKRDESLKKVVDRFVSHLEREQ